MEMRKSRELQEIETILSWRIQLCYGVLYTKTQDNSSFVPGGGRLRHERAEDSLC